MLKQGTKSSLECFWSREVIETGWRKVGADHKADSRKNEPREEWEISSCNVSKKYIGESQVVLEIPIDPESVVMLII